MKLLFPLLLVINILLLIYMFSDSEETALPELPLASNAPSSSIELSQRPVEPLSPQIKAKKATTIQSRTPSVELSGNKLCYKIGPFELMAEADRVKNELDVAGMASERMRSQTEIQDSYWVYLPPFASKSEAINTITKLKPKRSPSNGFVITTGPKQNGISFGIYKDKKNADYLYRDLVSKGYQPQISRRPQKLDQYWLNAVTNHHQEDLAMISLKKSIYGIYGQYNLPNVKINSIDCR